MGFLPILFLHEPLDSSFVPRSFYFLWLMTEDGRPTLWAEAGWYANLNIGYWDGPLCR